MKRKFTVILAVFVLAVLVHVSYHHYLQEALKNKLVNNDYEGMKTLVRRGANVNTSVYPDESDRERHNLLFGIVQTPLTMAVARDDFAVAKELIERGADVNFPDTFGQGLTYLMLACRLGDVRIVELLLAHGADIDATEAHGFSAEYFNECSNQSCLPKERERRRRIRKLIERHRPKPQ